MSPDPNVLAAMIFAFSITFLALTAKILKSKLEMRDQQKALGASNRELEQKVEKLEQANAEQARRLENLETIVVSQTWSAVQEPALADADRQQRLAATVRHEAHAPAVEEMNRQRAEQLARRLGG